MALDFRPASAGEKEAVRALVRRAYAPDVARQCSLNVVELYTNEIMQENLPFYAALGYEFST